jgi:hypothetical protein
MTRNTPSRGKAADKLRPSSAAAARQKAAAFRAAERARARRRRLLQWAAAPAALVVAAVVIAIAVATSGSGGGTPGEGSSDSALSTLTGPAGPEGIVLEQGQLLAPATGAATGETVDGVQCNSMEQAAFHIHTHITVYVNGALRPIPAGIGAVTPVPQQTAHGVFDSASRCFYWLHTHAQDGILHVEAPNHATYTLGQFFAIWRQPLTSDQVGPATGAVTAYVNGHRYTGNPAAITLASHEDVQLDVGTPLVAPRKIDWSHAQL